MKARRSAGSFGGLWKNGKWQLGFHIVGLTSLPAGVVSFKSDKPAGVANIMLLTGVCNIFPPQNTGLEALKYKIPSVSF